MNKKDKCEFYDIPLDEVENGNVSSNKVVTENIVTSLKDETHNNFYFIFVSFLIGFGSVYFIYKMM